jgi:cytochrome P450
MEFDPLAPDVQADPYPTYRWFREHEPVARNEALGAWFVFRFDDVLRALHDDRFVSGQGVSLTPGPPTRAGRTLIATDNPVHAEMRSAISGFFTPRAVARFEPRVRALVTEYLDAFTERGTCELMHDFAIPIPVIVVGDLLGVRAEDRQQFREWADDLVHQDPTRPATIAPAREAAAAIGRYFTAVIEERREHPGDDLISALLHTTVDRAPLPFEDLLGFAFLLIVAGTETTTNLVGNAALALDAHPDQRKAIASDLSLIPGAIEEVLRWDAPVQALARVVVENVTVGDVVLPAGSRVQLRFGSANRDDREFADAEAFDIRRSITRHVGLGHGIHYCLGASLSRLEGRIMLEEFVRRIPDWTVAGSDRHPSLEVRGPAHVALEFAPSRGGS